MQPVTAVFDIGKTNKKVLLFSPDGDIVYTANEQFAEIRDDDGDPCDDVSAIESWMQDCLRHTLETNSYHLQAVNISTYGATLAYLDDSGQPAAPVYNYLKPVRESLFDDLYNQYGGRDEFCRRTASPALGMLNSGLQIYWLQKRKPELWDNVRHILHFPQYLSYRLTGQITSEPTSIGCHTGMWDFDRMGYHPWLADYGIRLPTPMDDRTTFDITLHGKSLQAGIGIHDSSASLVPYLMTSSEPFVLVSTGTWAINMNPFNPEPLTADQLNHDCLCYMTPEQQQVKSSRLFLGRLHDVNLESLNQIYNMPADAYKQVQPDTRLMQNLAASHKLLLFRHGIPEDLKTDIAKLTAFDTFDAAYHQLMYELAALEAQQIKRILADDDQVKRLYVSGGFARNAIFKAYLDLFFPEKDVIASELAEATALGAALLVSDVKTDLSDAVT